MISERHILRIALIEFNKNIQKLKILFRRIDVKQKLSWMKRDRI